MKVDLSPFISKTGRHCDGQKRRKKVAIEMKEDLTHKRLTVRWRKDLAGRLDFLVIKDESIIGIENEQTMNCKR